MFIKYQKVRNAVVGTITAIVGGVAAFFGLQGDDKPTRQDETQVVAVSEASHGDAYSPAPTSNSNTQALDTQASSYAATTLTEVEAESNDFAVNASTAAHSEPAIQQSRPRIVRTAPVSKDQLYAAAMKIASSSASAAKGKDVLGSSSPWKLNLYDDNNDGRWDRGKLDNNRDDVDDERWTFKSGRWEKDGGATIWNGKSWVAANRRSSSNRQVAKQSSRKQTTAGRYQQAMKIAMGRATSSKGKDVLGPASPWKLNLYDDNTDGQWDRAKLDVNRDEVDDEKWNFKKGRWEKDGGASIWSSNGWVSAKASARQVAKRSTPDAKLARYRQAMKIATSRATSSKGKDVLGPSSPWKLNLYDDNNDGQWDRGKLDYNRDEVDDEKWNFKKGRWEKDGGSTIWNGTDWEK